MKEGIPITPDTAIYIDSHSNHTTEFPIFDFTSTASSPNDFLNPAFEDRLKSLNKTTTQPPFLKICRKGFFSKTLFILDHANNQLCEWKASWGQSGTTSLLFPPGSSISSHSIEMQRQNLFSRSENFVHNSFLYTWRIDSMLSTRRLVLYKQVQGREVEVAKFHNVSLLRSGGVLIVDSRQVNVVIASLTCCVMLRKIRQRRAAAGAAGGGGGGG